jgi:hypothetical protein
MSGNLQDKMYGSHKHSSTHFKSMGNYNSPVKRMGSYTSKPKLLGHYNGSGGGKSHLTREIHRYC